MQGMYSLGIQLMKLGFHLVAPFHPKAKLMVEGRKKSIQAITTGFQNFETTHLVSLCFLGRV